MCEYQTRFSSLHLKRMEVIEEIYRLLVLVEMAFGRMTSRLGGPGIPTPEETIPEFNRRADEFITGFRTKRLFFDGGSCGRVEGFITLLNDGAVSHEWWLKDWVQEGEKVELHKRVEKVKKSLGATRGEIERQFREYLCPVEDGDEKG